MLCAGNPATLKLIYDILDELCDIFPGKYFHLGGDEAPKDKWKKCPKCQSKIRELGLKNEEELHCSLVNRAAEYLEKKAGVSFAGTKRQTAVFSIKHNACILA